ncbi:hypothetical protein Pcinc_015718 [Petrolisthes cinctipes]|uniref:Sacsin/Nov domain-containing protein n=1 Tax=Petrolisthes cinctipes TaxID=88211 RepID=A0AAE1KPF5_PETCI|nr:hypothetical protein Pcinc_015718 [Petrolisthes cinctipes]
MPTVVGLLKNILSQYPDNGQIIKELVQNAEDAGASRVDVVHHTRCLDYPNAPHNVQRFIRSPALCIYNDAVFSEEDWRGIRKLSDSIKKNDPLRVGQFGLGFKSVFHLTDYVTILSGCQVLLMDTSEPEHRMCRLLSLSDLGKVFPEPLQLWGKYLTSQHLVEGTFPATVFWFPLRQKPSQLSPTVYSSQRVKELFDSFSVEAPICLTFLKSLEQVSLQRVATKDPKKAVVVHQVEIGGPDLSDVKKERQRLQQNLQQSNGCPGTSITCHYQVTLHNTKKNKINKQTMLVLHHLPGQQDKYCIKYKGIDAHRYIPLVGVAVSTKPMSTPRDPGCLFTFFPLPLDPANTTGLPVQVNAYFILDQNRRHVKWKTDESSKEPDVIWNESLVSEVVLEAYHKLLLQVQSQVNQGIYQHQLCYSLLPNLASTTGRWNQMATQLWRRIITLPILYSPQEQKFKTAENVITDIGLDDCSVEVKTCIRMVLKSHSKPLVKLPDHVTLSLKELNCSPPTVTPQLVREYLLGPRAEVVRCEWDRIALLDYITSDKDYHKQLSGLQLLPLNDGSWSTYSKLSEPIYICTSDEAVALWGLESKILFLDLPSVLLERLRKVTGTTQLVKFNAAENGLALLMESVNQVQQRKSPSGKQLQAWLEQVWSLLQQLELNTVAHLPLLPSCPSPTSPTALLSLSSPIIVQNNTQSLLPKSAVQALKLLGIEVVPQPPHYVRHHQLHSYLYNTSDGRGVNSALSKMISNSNLHNSVAYFNAKSSEVQQKTLVNAIDLNSLQPDVITFLAKLNIIKSVGKCGKPKNDCVERVKNIIPDLDDFPVNFPEALLKPQSIRHQQLAIILGAKLLSKEELCLLSLSNKVTYSEEEISKLALYILSDKNMMTNDICHQLQGLRFVPDVNNDLHLPGELYNPEDGDIDALIAEDLTPICHYHQYLPALVKLGLKKVVELPKHLLIQAIKHVQSNSITTEENNRKSRALLRVLEQRQDLEEVCKAVKDEAFIYGVTAKPRDYPTHLRWATKPDLLTPASLKSYSKYKDVLGSVMQLVQCSHVPKVAKGFDWDKDPDTSYFCDNFRNMITAYQSCTDGCFEMIKKIYKYLSEIAKSSEAHNLKCLSELPCVFTEYGFKLPHQVYLKPAMEDVNLLPYIYPLPYELRDWTDLFEYLGCFVNQSVDLYLKFLIDIQENHNTNNENNNVDRDMESVVSVLKKLGKNVEKIPPSQLLFPVENDDDSLELVKKELCSYSDQNCEWLSNDELGVRIVHKRVPLKLAHSLGVKQLSEHLVSGGEAMMECSQKEPLTTRLHNLVGQYRDGVPIIKELIQNADDAGATTVSFLYDERQNEDAKTRLLSPQLKQWQGPALWAFNDATFTEEDFQNLQLLGGGTKESQSTKIGKFGLGFCSIYNLTDVPSFMSGSSYVIFDPHLECLGHDKKVPGLRYNFGTKSNSRMLTKLLGQFKPFDKMFDCTIQDTKKYDGTLFRFPLRTPSQAAKSKICQISYDRTGMMQLFDMLWNIAGQLLLFTQNVKEIKVFSLACDASSPSEMKLLFESSSVPFNEPVMNIIQETPLKKANSLFRTHSKFQWNGNVYQEITMVNINVKSYPEWKEEKCQVKVGSESVTWLTSWHSGRPKGSVYHLAETLAGKALPLGAVSTPVCQDSSGWKPVCLKDLPSGFYRESRMHCFLSLPVKTTLPLPVQVNGYFEIASDRTSLLSQTSDDRQNLNWNTILIEESISSAYHTLLDNMIIRGQSTEVPYYNLWPLAADRNNDLVTTLITSFYQLLVKEKWRVFYSSSGWYPLNHCLFLEDNFYQQQIGKVAFEYMEIVLASSEKQQHLIELPEKIQAGFQYDCLSEYCISQNSFYTSYFIPTISDDNVTPKKRDAITLHMIDHVNTCVESLKGVACIPTSPNGKLRIPTDLVSPKSQVAKMYTESDERFPQNDFTNTSHRCQVLLDLGVKKSTIPIEWVKERACSVAEIRCLECALYRSTEILNYMAN